MFALLKALNPAVTMLARANSDTEVRHLLEHGADGAVLAERELADSLAEMVMATPRYRPARTGTTGTSARRTRRHDTSRLNLPQARERAITAVVAGGDPARCPVVSGGGVGQDIGRHPPGGRRFDHETNRRRRRDRAGPGRFNAHPVRHAPRGIDVGSTGREIGRAHV